jgi:hypothetical protein
MLVEAVHMGSEAGPAKNRLPLVEDDEELDEESEEPDTDPATIDQVTRRALQRVRRAEQALLDHLHAVESAATIRSELVIAQAELDAELIRLRARRTAHSLLTEASGEADEQSSRERRSLDELSRTLNRFAAVLDDVSTTAQTETSGRPTT